MATVSIGDWEYKKPINTDSNATTPGQGKAQPIILDGSLAEGNSGNTSVGYDTSRIDTSTTATKLESIVVTQSDESTTVPYEIENPEDLGTTNDVVVWAYLSSYTTGSTDFVIGIGGGDGTDYSQAGSGGNTWNNTGQSYTTVQHFEETNFPTDDAQDSSTQGINGTVRGAVSTSTDLDGGATFDGVDDTVDFGLDAWGFSDDQPFTYSFYIYPVDAGKDAGSVPQANLFVGNNGRRRSVAVNANDVHLIGYDGSNTQTVSTSGSIISNNQWYHIVVVFDGSTGEIFVNGTREASGSFTTLDGSYDDLMGGRTDDPGNEQLFDGDIAEGRVQNSAVSNNSAWASADYEATPEGGQVFFDVQAGQTTGTTDTPGSVHQTNSSGVKQTTSAGVQKTE